MIGDFFFLQTPGYPGVYARVTKALDWINEILDEPKCFRNR